MIELLILFVLSRKVLTMYGISKEIKSDFSPLMKPSYGTIKPALKRLIDSGFLKVQKVISKGGRPSCYYSVTKEGISELKNTLLEPLPENPIHFMPMARRKLSCADVLDGEDRLKLFKELKLRAEYIMTDISALVNSKDLSFYPQMT